MPTFKEFLQSAPLYESLDFTEAEAALIFGGIQQQSITFDVYCPRCREQTTWRVVRRGNLVNYQGIDDGRLTNAAFDYLADALPQLTFRCARNHSHIARFGLEVRPGPRNVQYVAGIKIEKYGQLPSLADIAASELDAYRKFVSPADLQELTRATGLAAHGIGIGSFVYLRRIFERLVLEAADHAAAADTSFDRKTFVTLRMEDKLQAVKGYVPDWMVENRKLYSILSVGLHELSEETCKAAFPDVKLAILSLLEQHAAEQQRQARAKQAAASLSKLSGTLAKE